MTEKEFMEAALKEYRCLKEGSDEAQVIGQLTMSVVRAAAAVDGYRKLLREVREASVAVTTICNKRSDALVGSFF